MSVLQNWPNFKKNVLHFLNFYQNFQNFFWWKIWLIGFFFHLIIAFGSIFFWLGCDAWKMDDHFQCPLWPISTILSKLATMLENDDWCQLSPKILRSFWWKLKESEPYPYPVGNFRAPLWLSRKKLIITI